MKKDISQNNLRGISARYRRWFALPAWELPAVNCILFIEFERANTYPGRRFLSKRRPIQKMLIVIAVISYLAAVGCAVAAVYMGVGSDDPIVASLMASVVFFVGVGIVLQVIGSVSLPNLKIER